MCPQLKKWNIINILHVPMIPPLSLSPTSSITGNHDSEFYLIFSYPLSIYAPKNFIFTNSIMLCLVLFINYISKVHLFLYIVVLHLIFFAVQHSTLICYNLFVQSIFNGHLGQSRLVCFTFMNKSAGTVMVLISRCTCAGVSPKYVHVFGSIYIQVGSWAQSMCMFTFTRQYKTV